VCFGAKCIGIRTVSEACAELGLGRAAFFKLRAKALEGALRSIEPKPMGRPPKLTTEEGRRIAELEEEPRQHRLALQAAHVNEELALTMPFLAERLKLERDLKRLRGGERDAGNEVPRAADRPGTPEPDAQRANGAPPVAPVSRREKRHTERIKAAMEAKVMSASRPENAAPHRAKRDVEASSKRNAV
jgi:hypothetical protein